MWHVLCRLFSSTGLTFNSTQYAYELNAAAVSSNIMNTTHNGVLFTFITNKMTTLNKQSIKISGHDDTEMSNSLRNGWPSKSVIQWWARNIDLGMIYKEVSTYRFYHWIKLQEISLFLDVWMQLILITVLYYNNCNIILI